MATRVVCVGGGYVALSIAAGLKKAVRRGEVELTFISKTNFHIWHGFIAEMLVGKIMPSQILSPARKIFAPGNVQVAVVERMDLDAQKIFTTRHPDGKPIEYEYDHLIIAIGSRQNTSAYPGLNEHAFKLKTWDDCFGLRNHLRKMFEQPALRRIPLVPRARTSALDLF
jgi:NADH dehydrogenase